MPQDVSTVYTAQVFDATYTSQCDTCLGANHKWLMTSRDVSWHFRLSLPNGWWSRSAGSSWDARDATEVELGCNYLLFVVGGWVWTSQLGHDLQQGTKRDETGRIVANELETQGLERCHFLWPSCTDLHRDCCIPCVLHAWAQVIINSSNFILHTYESEVQQGGWLHSIWEIFRII